MMRSIENVRGVQDHPRGAELRQERRMRIAIVSDIHANLAAFEAVIAHAEEIAVEVADAATEAVVETAGAVGTTRERKAMEKTSSSTMWLSRVVIVMSGRLTLIALLIPLLPIMMEFRRHVQVEAIMISWRVCINPAVMIQL